jgi:hypothetical protein
MPMHDWVKLVTAVGIDVRPMDAAEAYILEGKIIHDPELTKRALKFLEGTILPKDARIRAIKEMTPAERVELRDRILGVHVIGKTS